MLPTGQELGTGPLSLLPSPLRAYSELCCRGLRSCIPQSVASCHSAGPNGHRVANGLGLNPHGNLQGGPVIFILQVRRQRLRQMKGLLVLCVGGGHEVLGRLGGLTLTVGLGWLGLPVGADLRLRESHR